MKRDSQEREVQMKTMKVKSVRLNDITPYYNNPRDNSKAVAPTMESIRKFGFVKPILCDTNGVIICGHTRYIAAYQLGLEYVPVVYTEMSEENAKAFRIADNKLAENSTFDEEKLIAELKELEVPSEMQAFFFEDVEEMINFSFDDFKVPENPSFEDYSFESDDDGGEEFAHDGEYEDFGGSDDDYEESQTQKEEDPADGLFRVRVIDGRNYMKVVCPFCGNVETIEVD